MAYCAPRGIPLSEFLAWPEADQDAALGWLMAEAERCQGCGTSSQDWREDGWHAEIRLCHGCRARDTASKSKEAERPGMQVRLARGQVHDCEHCATS